MGFCRYLTVDGGVVTVAGPWHPVALSGARGLVPLLDRQGPASDGTGTPVLETVPASEWLPLAWHRPGAAPGWGLTRVARILPARY